MKRLISLTAIVLFHTCLAAHAASYLIQLQNGNEFLTNRHWQEGDQIMFSLYGGSVGIQKSFVANIKESSLVYQEKTTIIQAPLTPVEEKSSKAEATTEDKKEVESKKEISAKQEEEKIDFEYYRAKKAQLKLKVNETLEKFREASGNRDLGAQEKILQEMKDIGMQISALEDELKGKNKGVLPDWWAQL